MSQINQQSILERHTSEGPDGKKIINIVNIILELDARIKTTYQVIDEVKEIIQGYGAWSKEVEDRLDELKPKIKIASINDYNNAIKGL